MRLTKDVDSLNLYQVRLFYDILAHMAVSSSWNPDSAEPLEYTEMIILVRKQLSNASLQYRAIGVLGGVALIAQLARQGCFH